MNQAILLFTVLILLTTCQAGTTPTLAPTGVGAVQSAPATLPAGTATASPGSTPLTTPPPPVPLSESGPVSFSAAEAGSLVRQANGLVIDKNIAYVTSWEGLHLLDLSDPASPRELGLYPTPEQSAAGVTVAGSTAYVMAIGLHLVDVSEPDAPRQLGFYQPPPAPISTPAVAGDTVYLAAGETGLIVVDASEPAAPRELTRILAEDARRVVVAGTTAYLLDRAGVRLLDISEPAAPHQLGLYRVDNAQDISIAPSPAGNLAYVLTRNALQLVDVSDPTLPQVLGSYAPEGEAISLALHGKRAYLATAGLLEGYGGLEIVDISNPAAPRLVGFIAATAEEPWYEGGTVRVYEAAGRVDIYAVSRFGGALFVFPNIQERLSSASAELQPTAGPEPTGPLANLTSSMPMTSPLSETSPATEIPVTSNSAADFELIGALGGAITTVRVQEQYAYLGEGLKLVILDISEPANPRPVGSLLLPQSPRDLEVAGSYAYVAHNGGMSLIDITNPASPALVGVYTRADLATSVTLLSGQPYVYLTYNQGYDLQGAPQGGGVAVVDVSNPVSPVEMAVYQTPYFPLDLALEARAGRLYAYLAEETGCGLSSTSQGYTCQGQVRILDFSEPGRPLELAVYETPQTVRQIIAAEGRLFVTERHCNDEVGCQGGVALLDVSDPARPRQLGFYDKPTERIAVAGSYLYTSDPLTVVEISDPAAPQERGASSIGGRIKAAAGGYAYLVDWQGKVVTVDLSNPANPLEAGLYEAPGPRAGLEVKVKDNYAYVTDHVRRGLAIIDILDLSRPKQVGFLAIESPGRVWEVSPPYLYVGDEWLEVNIIDISNPTAPVLAGVYRLPEGGRLRAVTGGYAYITTFSGFQRVDLSNPRTPREAGFYELASNLGILGLAAAGDYVYFAAYEDVWQVVDWTKPQAPVEQAFSTLPLDFQAAVVAGPYAYYNAAGQGMQILDLSNPAAPLKVGFYRAPGMVQKVAAVENGYAFVVVDLKLHLVDISNPAAPVEVGRYDGLKPVEAAAGATGSAGQPYAYLYSSDRRFQVLDLSNPASPLILGNLTLSSEQWLPASDMVVAGPYAYLYDRSGGSLEVMMIDISNPAEPVEVGLYKAPGPVRAIQAQPGTGAVYGYVVDYDNNFRLVDLSNPAAPAELSRHKPSELIVGLTVQGQNLYLNLERGPAAQTLQRFDLSNPVAPVQIGTYEINGDPGALLAMGNYTYTPAGQWLLRVVDVSNPAQPVNVGVSRLPAGSIEQLLVGEGLAFTVLQQSNARVLDAAWTLHLTDISDPAAPQAIGAYKPQAPALYQLQGVSGDYLYFLDQHSRLRRIDISNPASPQEVIAAYTPKEIIRSITVAGTEVYLSMDEAGLAILRLKP